MNLNNIIKKLKGLSDREILKGEIAKELEEKELKVLREKLSKLQTENHTQK